MAHPSRALLDEQLKSAQYTGAVADRQRENHRGHLNDLSLHSIALHALSTLAVSHLYYQLLVEPASDLKEHFLQ